MKNASLALALLVLPLGSALAATEYSSSTTRRTVPSRPIASSSALQVIASGGEGGPSLRGTRAGIRHSSVFGITYQVQPRALQGFGVFAIGPTVNAYPGVRIKGNTPHGYRNGWGMGGIATWQATMSPVQWFVPVVSYAAEYNLYSLTGGESGHFVSHGPKFGAWISLGSIFSEAGERMSSEYGVTRTYAVIEYAHLRGGAKDSNVIASATSDESIGFNGQSIQFGLRFEY